ncbi:helix-turn-helix domain-containing protein [Kitasatospora sp. NPDC059327]|uniref:helix-turn-helix domain-containing protein n=1 Tax=Kitasatospora sp. NPDC059327 TaxID=3346803 RepID=UPI00368E4788
MGRPRTAVAAGAVAGHLAEYLQALCTRSGRTYAQMAAETSPRVSVSTLSRAASGKRRPQLDVVQAFVRACGGTPSELAKAERLWRRTPSSASAGRARHSGLRWREPESLSEVHHLGELMRAAHELSGSPSLRAVQERAAALGQSLPRSTLGDALRRGAVPSEHVFCVFMRAISDFAGSPTAEYGAEVWKELWRRVRADRPGRARGDLPPGPVRSPGVAARTKAVGARTPAGRRPRRVPPRAWVRPGPLKDFKDWVHTLYLEAGAPSLTDIVGAIRLDDSLDFAPERDSVNRLLRSSSLGSQGDAVAVAVALAHTAGVDPVTTGGQARELWIRAAAVRPYGHAVGEVTDPLALGVREAFALPDAGVVLPVLVPYVRRQHDQVIDGVVYRAVGGQSAMVVARGPRTTGKTRSCWEALRGLPGSWRLWFPADPSNGEQLVEALSQAGPGTVVWLDRVDRYLDPAQFGVAGQVHAEIREALHDPRRAPILVIGTVSTAAGVLTRSGGPTPGADAAARTLIDDSAVDVPAQFTTAELARLAEAVGRDPRLALAGANARGSVAQYLSTSRNTDPLLKIQTFHRAVMQGDADTLHMGGALLQQSGRLEEAATWYQRAAEAGDVQALEPAAALLSESGAPYEAVAWLRTLAEAGDADAAVVAARWLLRTGRDHEAIDFYQLAAVDRGASHALRAAASLMRRHGRGEEAVEWLRSLAAAGNPIALREAARLLWEAGDTTRALRFLSEAGSAGDLEAWRDAAERLQALGRDDEAILVYRVAVQKEDERSVLPLADLLATVGRQEEALAIYLRAAAKPDLAAIRRAAALYRMTERPDDALRWYRRAAELGDMTAFMHIGLILREKCELAMADTSEAFVDEALVDEAVASFTKAADVGEWHAHREAAWMLWRSRGLDEAAAWLRQRVEAKDHRALREMADLLREAGEPAQALAWYQRSAKKGSEYSAGYALRLQSQLPSGAGGRKAGRTRATGGGTRATEATEEP